MTKPEKRWQLLLVADDGRIVPFKRIKGLAVSLVTLLVLLVVVCAGLGWQLTAEKVRHRKTLGQLTDANQQVAHFKSERELITAELVLAEVRLEKAGMLIPKRQERVSKQIPVKTADSETVPKAAIDEGKKEKESETMADATTEPAAAIQPSTPPVAAPVPNMAKETAPEATPAEVTVEPEQPAVVLGDLEIQHNAEEKILRVRFRVNNSGPRSSPVAGQCVVVLKNSRMDPEAWLAMPDVHLVNGKPDGMKGQAFRISRFRDMEISATGQTDPSSFKTATIYVFDTRGAKILEKEYPIDLPAPMPVPEPVSKPVHQPASQPVPTDSTAATVNLPSAKTPNANAGAAPQAVPASAPVDDPSLTDGVEPVKKEDARSRF